MTWLKELTIFILLLILITTSLPGCAILEGAGLICSAFQDKPCTINLRQEERKE